jgi:hypothetical protein
MSDQRNHFVQDEVYENLEVRAVTVQIAVCCDLTPRGLLDTYRCTGTPAASIVVYAEEKVPDFFRNNDVCLQNLKASHPKVQC